VYTHLSTAIAWCLANNHDFAWNGDLQFYGNWDDWFLRFWTLDAPPNDAKTICYIPDWQAMAPIGLEILANYPPLLIQHIWRLRPDRRSEVDASLCSLGLNKCRYVAVQVRRGDKIATGQLQLVSSARIAAAIPRWAERLFVATDDYVVVEELNRLLTIPVVSLCPEVQRGSFGEYDRWSKTDAERYAEVARLIHELEICRLADCFIQIRPLNRAGSLGVGRNYQISDMIADLRFRKGCRVLY
jgi:hypothetical protein